VPDVRPYLADADVVICPLQVARGVQNKILEAMAMARAVVASPGGIDGLDVQVGQEVLRAESPQQWVEAIEGLLGDPARRDAVGRAARSRVEAGYTWPARLAPLVSLCNELAGLPSERSPERPHVPRVFDNPRKVAAI
jgi:glycosyltransferase involved in cell wall biosynthesis